MNERNDHYVFYYDSSINMYPIMHFEFNFQFLLSTCWLWLCSVVYKVHLIISNSPQVTLVSRATRFVLLHFPD